MRMSSRHLEELTLDAWPPLQTLLYDGWLLGFSGGYTRLANSVQPLYPSTLPLSDKIATCEAMFADRGLPIAFKVTSGAADPDLDATLERLGYAIEGSTSVQATDLLHFPTAEAEPTVTLQPTLTDEWF
jgi:N-acetylglutamate synthase